MEVLLIDNNSEDNSKMILRKYANRDKRIKIFYSKNNTGAFGGLNYLLNRSVGEYIAISDHDDIWHPDKLKKQVEFLKNNLQYVGCGTEYFTYIESDGSIGQVRIKLEEGVFVPHPSLVYRNNGYQYNTKIKYKTDTYFMKYILCEEGERKLKILKEPLFIHRVRNDGKNFSHTMVHPKNIYTYFVHTRDLLTTGKALILYVMPDLIKNKIYKKLIYGGQYISLSEFRENIFNNKYIDFS